MRWSRRACWKGRIASWWGGWAIQHLCKGPEVGIDLVYSGNNQNAAWQEQRGQEEGSRWGQDRQVSLHSDTSVDNGKEFDFCSKCDMMSSWNHCLLQDKANGPQGGEGLVQEGRCSMVKLSLGPPLFSFFHLMCFFLANFGKWEGARRETEQQLVTFASPVGWTVGLLRGIGRKVWQRTGRAVAHCTSEQEV
jgi:hypothetical protein